MNKNENKKVLKEDEGLSTPKPINKYLPSDTEKVIIALLEKEFKDFALKNYQHRGETQYINLNLETDLKDEDDLKNDLESNRYVIAKIMSEFRINFFTGLSKYLNVVNVKVGPYDYVKGNEKLNFNCTILLSDNNISDWVSGTRKKVEPIKDLVKESKNKMKNSEKNIRQILTQLHESVLNETKVTQSFPAKDEFAAKTKLTKLGFKANAEKAGVVRVSYNSKKHTAADIQKLIESSQKKDPIKTILESIYREVLNEAPNREPISKKKAPIAGQLDEKTNAKLEKDIIAFSSLSKELEKEEAEFRASLEKKYDKLAQIEDNIFDTMKSVDLNLKIINNITAKISADYTRVNVKNAIVIEQLLLKVNPETKKLINTLKKKNSTKTKVQGKLSIEDTPEKKSRKSKQQESIQLREGLFDWFKNVFFSFKKYLSGITIIRKKFQEIANEMGI